jgi:hypothetical protein
LDASFETLPPKPVKTDTSARNVTPAEIYLLLSQLHGWKFRDWMSDVQTSFLVDVLSGRLGSGILEPFPEVRIVPKRRSRSGKNEKFGKSVNDGCRAFMFQSSACRVP